MSRISQPPTNQPINEVGTGRPGGRSAPTGFMSQGWIQWFLELVGFLSLAPRVAGKVRLTDQAASIGATQVPMDATVSSGLFRVSFYVRTTRPATTSSSLAVSIGWTDGGVTCGITSAPITGNTTATFQSGSLLVRIDDASPLVYAVEYASVGGVPMQYAFDVLVEECPRD